MDQDTFSGAWRRTGRFALMAGTMLAAVAAADIANAEEYLLEGILSGDSLVPAADTEALGSVGLNFNSDNNEVTWIIAYSGLSGPVVSVQLHGPGGPGENAPAVVTLIGDLSNPILGGSTLSRANADYLIDSQLYLVITTAAFPEGELRGQLHVVGSEVGGGDE